MKHIIDGVRYNVVEYGDGFPLLLLHGFTGDTTTWQPFFEILGNHSKCYAVDIIGHGESDSPTKMERYRMMSVADDLFLLMEKLGIVKADILGYSMGGRLALSFAEKYPGKVRKLVLESSSPGLQKEEERKERARLDENLAAFIEQRGITEFVDYWESIPLFKNQETLPKPTKDCIREQRLRNTERGLAGCLRGMGTGVQPSWWDELGKVEIETLLVTGSLDKKFGCIAKQMSEEFPNCRWASVSGSGHAIHVEDPRKFVKIVSGFLSNP